MNIDELVGYDIDWFAVDDEGTVGIFCTSGSLSIPKSAVENLDEHMAIAKGFDLPNFGSRNIWKDYGRYGLFVYDYKLYSGPYVRQEFPLSKIDESLKLRILQIKDLPRLEAAFITDITIEIQ